MEIRLQVDQIHRADQTDRHGAATLWNMAGPNEYGFYANVNPEVDHPRWSQATERRIGGGLFADAADADVQRLCRRGGGPLCRHGPERELLMDADRPPQQLLRAGSQHGPYIYCVRCRRSGSSTWVRPAASGWNRSRRSNTSWVNSRCNSSWQVSRSRRCGGIWGQPDQVPADDGAGRPSSMSRCICWSGWCSTCRSGARSGPISSSARISPWHDGIRPDGSAGYYLQ